MFQKLKFKNGLRLILAPQAGTKAVTVLVLLPVGSRYENPKNNGVSHFIEHLMFKGTKKRPTTLDISKELDNIGAQYNAYTSKDHTGYYIKAPAEKIELLFDILSDMLFNSKFDSIEIDKERGVIVEEINMYEDNPLIYVDTLFEELAYGKNPLSWQISGTREIIRKIKRDDIVNYKQAYYQPYNMVLTVAGKFQKSKVVRLSGKYFFGNNEHTLINRYKKFKTSQKFPQIKLHFKESQQIQLCLGFLAYSFFHKNVYALNLLAIILGGNMSSRLFINVRERHGLAYFIKAGIGIYQDTGSLIIQAGLDKSRIDQAIKLILRQLKKVKDEGVTQKELQGAKDFLRGKLILELEDSENIADIYGKQAVLLKEILTPEQRLKKIYQVKMQDIQRVANDIFKVHKLNIALIGPFKDEERFLKLLHG